MPRTLAAIFAHPDDETFAVGGTLARHAGGGGRSLLYCATDGDAGKSSGIAVSSREALGRLRRAELEAAARVLGIGEVRLGGHPDGALAGADQEALIGEIVALLRAARPGVVVTFGPEGAPTGHRDHGAISRAATAAFFLAALPSAYPEQGAAGLAPFAPSRLYYVTFEPPMPEGLRHPHGLPVTARLAVAPFDAVRREAFEAHRTQHQWRDRFEEAAMKPEEQFFLVAGVPQPRAVVEDLFEGL